MKVKSKYSRKYESKDSAKFWDIIAKFLDNLDNKIDFSYTGAYHSDVAGMTISWTRK